MAECVVIVCSLMQKLCFKRHKKCLQYWTIQVGYMFMQFSIMQDSEDIIYYYL